MAHSWLLPSNQFNNFFYKSIIHSGKKWIHNSLLSPNNKNNLLRFTIQATRKCLNNFRDRENARVRSANKDLESSGRDQDLNQRSQSWCVDTVIVGYHDRRLVFHLCRDDGEVRREWVFPVSEFKELHCLLKIKFKILIYLWIKNNFK